jgi:hypothetical protein
VLSLLLRADGEGHSPGPEHRRLPALLEDPSEEGRESVMRVLVDPVKLETFSKVWFDNSCVQIRLWGTRDDWGIRVFSFRDVVWGVSFPRGPLYLGRAF